jgi:hypothetical protein
MPARRFPPPWTIEEADDACFIVRENNRQALGYFYFEDELGRRSAAKLLSRDEARRMAVNVAKLHCNQCARNLFTYLLGVVYTQRCTASAVSVGFVLKHSFVEAGAYRWMTLISFSNNRK